MLGAFPGAAAAGKGELRGGGYAGDDLQFGGGGGDAGVPGGRIDDECVGRDRGEGERVRGCAHAECFDVFVYSAKCRWSATSSFLKENRDEADQLQ